MPQFPALETHNLRVFAGHFSRKQHFLFLAALRQGRAWSFSHAGEMHPVAESTHGQLDVAVGTLLGGVTKLEAGQANLFE
jgi:hypothetical protein